MENRELHGYIDPESQKVVTTSETRRRTHTRRRPVVGIAIVLLVCVACVICGVCAVLAALWRR
jgi:hypothetical protein